ncbi:hypothetical protein [Amycolatopsis thermoflava]|uniref:hypothetical protein n=1 Tax=Amycolatopsis thermoflava TaxID=84480 RepID=UPI0036548976
MLPHTEAHPWTGSEIWRRIPEVWAWTTWSEISTTISDQLAVFTNTDPSVQATVTRAAQAVIRAIAWPA